MSDQQQAITFTIKHGAYTYVYIKYDEPGEDPLWDLIIQGQGFVLRHMLGSPFKTTIEISKENSYVHMDIPKEVIEQLKTIIGS